MVLISEKSCFVSRLRRFEADRLLAYDSTRKVDRFWVQAYRISGTNRRIDHHRIFRRMSCRTRGSDALHRLLSYCHRMDIFPWFEGGVPGFFVPTVIKFFGLSVNHMFYALMRRSRQASFHALIRRAACETGQKRFGRFRSESEERTDRLRNYAGKTCRARRSQGGRARGGPGGRARGQS